MPACLTHFTFAKEMTPKEEKPFFDVIALGTQGSDPFFYYGILPFWSGKDKDEMQDVGERVHHEEIGIYYSKMASFALRSPKKEMLFAYLDALWMHYCVDRNLHPYVFSRSGVNEEGMLKGFYKYSHGCFEAVLDAFFARKHGTFRKTSSTIDVKEEDLIEISRMWACLSDTFPILKEDSYYRAAKAYKGVEGVLWSKSGLKRILFRLVGKHSLAYGMSYPKFYHHYDYVDVLNERHETWVHPTTNVASNESIEDLFEKAKEEYKVAHALLMEAKEGKDKEKEFIAFVNSRNHDGFVYGDKIKYFNLCWKN